MTRADRAMQIWQILIAAAHNRQTLTYGQIADHLQFERAGVLSQPLDRITFYCISKNLPPLTCLVVNQKTGIPGSGFTNVGDLPHNREAVYQQNWFALPPAQISDFEADA